MLKDGGLLAWLYHQSISKLSLRIFSRLFNIWPHSFILSLIHCDFYWISEKWFLNLVHLVSIFIDIRDRDWLNFKQELDQSFPFFFFFSFFSQNSNFYSSKASERCAWYFQCPNLKSLIHSCILHIMRGSAISSKFNVRHCSTIQRQGRPQIFSHHTTTFLNLLLVLRSFKK